jgi:hypothetical protein
VKSRQVVQQLLKEEPDASGAAAFYTAGGKPLRIIRKVIIRTTARFNYF